MKKWLVVGLILLAAAFWVARPKVKLCLREDGCAGHVLNLR